MSTDWGKPLAHYDSLFPTGLFVEQVPSELEQLDHDWEKTDQEDNTDYFECRHCGLETTTRRPALPPSTPEECTRSGFALCIRV